MIFAHIYYAVYLQDRILPRILPYYGIIYLPMTFPIYDQGVGFFELTENHSRSEYAKDCVREPWPAFPEELVQAFVIELSAILSRSSFIFGLSD